MAATAKRRAQGPRILSTNLILQIHPSSGYALNAFPRRSQIAIRQRSGFFTALSRPLYRPGAAEERTENISVVRVQ
jgi:hypothetical protein